MHRILKISVLPIAALAVACGRGESSEATALTAELVRDLEAASSSGGERASTARDEQPTRFGSASESPRNPMLLMVKRRVPESPGRPGSASVTTE